MIIFENVSKVYPNGVVGLKDINLTIEDGEFVSIIGLSGAGKSTLLRAINRLVPITDGNIQINGTSITKANKRELRLIRRQIGLISQSFNLVKRSTVQKNVLSGRLGYYSTWKSIFGLFTQEDYQRTKEALETVGLSDKMQTRSDELSGGQQQRVCVARVLATSPKIILLDEPTSALDPISAGKIEETLYGLQDRYTMLLVTRSMQQASRISDKTAFFLDGDLIEYNDTNEMFLNPAKKETEDYVSGKFG